MEIADIIKKVCEETHVPMAQAVFGDSGLNAIFSVMNKVQELYQHVEPERITGRVIIYQIASPRATAPAGRPADFAGVANAPITDLCFEVASDGQAYERTLGALSIEALAATAVVYHYQAAQEEFLAGTQRKTVLRLDSSARSQFAVPTFADLRQALQRYARENVRESTCYVFRKVWQDDNRLFFKAGPESLMRDSLLQFLSNRLGGNHDVWPEQKVNEKHPVDIRVQTRLSNNRLMLIEIKWLGDSVAADGHVTAAHRDSRAQEGADQLANYLDEQLRSAPSRVVQGYYVIIDGRRRLPAAAAPGAVITRADGLHYETQELTFDPDPQRRPDFDAPYRMFARPVCSD